MKKYCIFSIIFVFVILIIGTAEAQGQGKSTKTKSNVVANEITKKLQEGMECIVMYDINFSQGTSKSKSFKIQDHFLLKKVSMNKVGTAVRKQRKKLLTNEWYYEYSAPILFTVEGRCSSGHNKGKSFSVKAEDKLELDQWGEWHYNTSPIQPSEVCTAIHETCVRDLAKEAAEKEAAVKKMEDAKEAEQAAKLAARANAFVEYANGIVLQKRTNLMWAAQDNGSRITWRDAKSYCEEYREGGFADWRMPTLSELMSLYKEGKEHNIFGELIKLDRKSLILWSTPDKRFKTPNTALHFGNTENSRIRSYPEFEDSPRVLPVRFVQMVSE